MPTVSRSWMFLCLAALSWAGLALIPGAQDFRPPPSKKPDAETLKAIVAKAERLARAIGSLKKRGLQDPWLADIEVFYQAASWIVKLDEFFQPESANWALEVLARGLLRAKFASEGEFPWAKARGISIVRGYRSRIDGSVQPFAVSFPLDYGKDEARRWRLDVVLHGRDSSLNEVKFLHMHSEDKAAPRNQDFIRLDIFGRGNNAYRWAGGADVFEALENFLTVERSLSGERIDMDRLVLRGFSMGGAGTWHLGLHRPDQWCVLGPGAGFTTTHGYVPKLPDKLPPYQEACLRIYDAVDYAENAFNVPIVAYSGSEDPQKLAADLIEARLKKLDIPMTHLVAPGLGHEFPAEWQKKAEGFYAKLVAKGKPEFPPRVRFVTYTMRYPSCYWVEILGLGRHYELARVDAERQENGMRVQTQNVRALRLGLPPGFADTVALTIDGQKVVARPWNNSIGQGSVYLESRQGKWKAVLPQRLVTKKTQMPQKMTGLQGPIDDAFTDSFLCVKGTGRPWHKSTQDYADAALGRFQEEWARFWRGQLPIKDDTEVTTEDIGSKHLILFGDPACNSLIAQVLDGLPLTWTRKHIGLGGLEYSAKDHVPVMIYPSPLNALRYVVLNSGHTFHPADYKGTNALLYPRLGDFAVLRLDGTKEAPLEVDVRKAGLFDEFWKLPTSD